MKTFNINTDLKTHSFQDKNNLDEFLKSFKETNKLVHDNINGAIFHNNYMEYLALCWDYHYGVIISPDILWNMVICEIANVVKNSPEEYRDIFTTENYKQEICVLTNDPVVLPLNSIIQELEKLVLVGVDTFIPTFSTTTERSYLAQCASFADTVSPFYKYSMYLCGITSIRVLGNDKDWEKFLDHLAKLTRIFVNKNKVNEYLNIVYEYVNQISTSNDSDFFKDIFCLERCGSGGEVEVSGWITNFYIEQPSPSYTRNFSSHKSVVNYENKTTNKNFKMYSGLFSSTIDDENYLVPEFSIVVFEK